MKRLILIAFVLLLGTTAVSAQIKQQKQASDTQIAVIALPRLCCQSSAPIIDNAMAYERGVKSWEVSYENKTITVIFKPKKTNKDNIAKALAKAGFESEGFPADKKAIERLSECCKNTAKGLESGCENKK